MSKPVRVRAPDWVHGREPGHESGYESGPGYRPEARVAQGADPEQLFRLGHLGHLPIDSLSELSEPQRGRH